MKKTVNATGFDRIYRIFLHIALIGMASLILILAHQNRKLKEPLATKQLEVGDSAHSVDLHDLAGGRETLKWATGIEKDRILMIFTTSCPFCLENQTAWSSIYEELQGDAEVIGISLDDLNASQIFSENYALPFPVVVPVDSGKFSQDYHITSVPLTIHVDSHGKVRGIWPGVLLENHLDDLRSSIANASSRG